MEKSQRQIARAALVVMVAFAISRVLGLVRQIVFSHYFGTGPEMDAYVAAMRIPEAIFMVVAGGALGSAFIPLFSARLTRDEAASAWRLASAIINILLVVLVPLSLLCMMAAPWLVRVFVAPASPPDVQVETATLMRVMLLSTAIFGVSGIIMGILNAHQHFLLPAIAPILYNVMLIAGAVWGGLTGIGTMGSAIGMVAGAVLHLVIQLPGLRRYGARFSLTLGLADAGVREVGKLMAPRMLGVAAWQLNMVVTNNLASRWGLGAISALEYAFRLMMLPQGVFAQAVGTAAFPTFSAQAARGDLDELRATLLSTLRTVIAIALPASAGMILLARPLIAMLYQYGAFDPEATREVAWALSMFSLGLLAYSVVEVLARAFYAMQDTWMPAITAILSVATNVLMGMWLPLLFAPTAAPAHAGLALANALATSVEMVVLLAIFYRRVGGFDVKTLLGFVGRVALATLGMSLVLWGWVRFVPLGAWLQGLGGIALGVGVYVGLALLLRLDELKRALRLVMRRH
ncbi:MAG: murein biosynthesis integral membrane protein MurJ [Anaerolineae bacterium]|nr:murein biosynthesis integral membrane protein MurJ [Anaerolineae bacterium]